MKIAVYCSANDDIAETYYEKTRELAQWMAREGHTLVWGGGNCGLMGCLGDEMSKNGGFTEGIVPRPLVTSGRMHSCISQVVMCEGLHDRKEHLIADSDIAIALPGGIGTLDEIFTQAGSHTIGFHRKMVLLYDINGFWQTTVQLLEHLQREKMVRGHWTDFIRVVKSLDEIADFCKNTENK